jgi:dihydrofolate reductase
MPDAQVHEFVNDLERPIGTYLYGRRMYEAMAYWETNGDGPDDSAISRDYAQVWRAADKVVYSRSLTDVTTARTRLARDLDVGELRRFKESSASDISIGGAEIANQAVGAGLVDEVSLFLFPVVVGAGKAALSAGTRLQLLEERRFDSGVVFVRYRVETSG